jgi:hypothetical protein
MLWLSAGADAWGTVALLFCLGAGAAYQQPPMRNTSQKAPKEAEPLLSKKESMV